jgi:Helix-turn-helix domain
MTQRQTVLKMLDEARVDRRGVTNGEFADAGILRYSARIKELRKQGYRIAKQRLSAGGWRYTLLKDSGSTGAPASGDRQITGDVGLPRPEYQAGAGVPVDPEPFDTTERKPMSPYDYERLVA